MEIEWCPSCGHDISVHAESQFNQQGELNTCAGARFCGCSFNKIQLVIIKLKELLEAQSK